MAEMQEKNVLGDSQEKLTRQPEDKETQEARPESPTEPTGAKNLGEKTQDASQPPNKLDPAHSFPAPGTESHGIYTNWQFIIVFVSISLGFNASFLGTVNSWNGGQVFLPAMLLLRRIYNLLRPINLLAISAGVNVANVADGLDLAQMAHGVNTTQLESSLFPDDMFWGVVHTNPQEFASGFNFTGIARSLNMGEILPSINVTQIASGLQMADLVSGLNVTNSVPAAYNEFPAGVHDLRSALWIYPTLMFTQTLSSVFFGRLSDYVGRRWIFLFGNAVSLAAFLAAGRSDQGVNMTGLSALLGIGTGIQVLGPWLALAELVPVRQRFTVTGLCLSLLGPLLVLHVIVVSALERNTSEGWRWGYYINAIFSFASLIGLFIAYHPPTYHQLHNHPVDDPPVKDWLGLSIFTTAIAMVTYSLGWGKFIWVWSAPQTIAVITISGFVLLAFLVYEYNYGNDHNAYPAYLMRSLTHVSQMALAGLHSLVWWFAPIAQLVVFLTVTPRFGLQGAWENLWAAGLVAGFLLASLTLIQPKYLKWHVAVGAVFGMGFLACLRALIHTNQYRLSMAFFFLAGLGHGYVTVVLYVTGPMSAHKRDMGLVVGLVSAYRNMIFSVIRKTRTSLLYVNQLMGKMQRILLPAFAKAGPVPKTLRSILDGIAEVQATGDMRALTQLPITKTMTNALATTCGRSWQYVIVLAYIYFFVVMIYSFVAPSTDRYLSDRVNVRLNRGGLDLGGFLRLPSLKGKAPQEKAPHEQTPQEKTPQEQVSQEQAPQMQAPQEPKEEN
ncbi:uncharacterized protein BDW47DRAFT_117436 [Aspergillus candidus]|uniref:Major facilitator superfamily (MFS) profile domain-containing protein n=1 Tax=Aspergillus candidus TaxID=41067 RepID=A0A2I2FC00_ASPCN|nr:hypothetical protein BDW47DRAFT_117436 [Aspergillus candidus]PLB38150.1 hypothetical protein BDW47DRAFT_117436 [Aspergillus candidus]